MKYKHIARLMAFGCALVCFSSSRTVWSQSPATAVDSAAKVVDLEKLKHPLQPALWKIEGNGLTEPSYLFGTVHHKDSRVTVLHPAAEKAFDQAAHFYSEMEKNSAKQQMAMMKLLRRDGKTLTESLGPELTKEVKATILAIDPDYNLQNLQILKTWVASLMIPTISKPGEGGEGKVQPGAKSLDDVLYQRAKKASKKIGAMETADSQAAVFEQFTEEEQIQFVEASVGLLKKSEEQTEPVKRLHELYLTNDLVELAKRTSSEAESEELGSKELGLRLNKALKGDRNVKMADKIEGLLAKTPDESHFFAVGVGHYIGDDSVTEMLVEKGYTVTPAFEPLDPKLEIQGYASQRNIEVVRDSKAKGAKDEMGTSLADIRWGAHLAGPKLQKTDKLENKVVLLVLWGS